jgi:hypothetical protein
MEDAKAQWDAIERRRLEKRMRAREGTEIQRHRFDLCLAKFQMLQVRIGNPKSAWPVEELLGVHTRRTGVPTPADYLADFAITGKQALRCSPLGLQLFELRYLQGNCSSDVKKALSLTEETLEHYTAFVKSTVGRALRTKRMVPGRRFREEFEKSKK